MAERFSGKQTIETDVVVVGYGGAGATAAITAHDNGAAVVVLEKTAQGGGNTRISGGGLVVPTSMEAARHFEALCFGKTDRKIIDAYVENGLRIRDWLQEMGGETQHYSYIAEIIYPFPKDPCWPNIPHAESTSILKVVASSKDERPAEPLWKLLMSNVRSRQIDVLTGTPAMELITDDKGEINGVVAERDGDRISIKARRAVILACGGFNNNQAMKDAYLPLSPLYSRGHPGNTGDGITMAEKVGAAMWHMYTYVGNFSFKTPEYDPAFTVRFHGPGFIYVGKSGRRFTPETAWEAHEVWKSLTVFRPDRPSYPQLPVYAVFDDVTRRKGPLDVTRSGLASDYYKWSPDNAKEIKKGWIHWGRTIRKLAKRISIDESTLENTVAGYNEYCRAGRDAEFERPKETLEPLEVAPYYAIELWPDIANTQGGPRRDAEARVLNKEGKPIPRLYSAGELGSLWGFLYPGGNLTEALVFGRIAGRNAAAEKPWR